MVGIPMDRVGAGMLECGCYCTASGSGCCLGCVSQVVGGTLCALNPSVVPNFSPKQWAWCAVPTADFLFGVLPGVVAIVAVVWGTLLVLLSITS